MELQEPKMTFPQDQIRDDYHPEEHSPVSIVLVSAIMIAAALGAMIAVF